MHGITRHAFFKYCTDSKYLNHKVILGRGEANLMANDKYPFKEKLSPQILSWVPPLCQVTFQALDNVARDENSWLLSQHTRHQTSKGQYSSSFSFFPVSKKCLLLVQLAIYSKIIA